MKQLESNSHNRTDWKRLESKSEHHHTQMTVKQKSGWDVIMHKTLKKSGWKKVEENGPRLELGSLTLESDGQALCHDCSSRAFLKSGKTGNALQC